MKYEYLIPRSVFFNSNLNTLQQLFDKSHLNFSQKRVGSVLFSIKNEQK